MALRIFSYFLSLIFLASGGAKLAGLTFEIEAFERWGYSLLFMYFIGVVEMLGALGLALKRFSAAAAAGLALMMIGAIGTHVMHAEWGMLVVAALIFTLCCARATMGRLDISALMHRKFAA